MSTTLTHNGLPAGVGRLDLLSLVEDLGKRGLRISNSAARLLRHYVWRSRDSDYSAGCICAVWDRVSGTAERLDLCSRAINEAERELERKGLIARTTGGNGARSGFRSGGLIRWAAGINLAPLIDQYAELRSIREARCLQQQAVATCKAEIRRLRRLIRAVDDPALVAKADAILPDGRMAPINRIDRLTAIKAALEALLPEIAAAPRATESSDGSEETRAPNIQNQDSSRTCTRPRRDCPPVITPRAALELASDEYRALADAHGPPSWRAIIEASSQMAKRLGISQGTWGQACLRLGRERAALCVLVVDRNTRLGSGHRYRVRHPGKCLSGMVRSFGGAGFNLHGLLRALQRPADALAGLSEAEVDGGPPVASLAQQILSRTARLMGDQA